jgi:hypothetical protein
MAWISFLYAESFYHQVKLGRRYVEYDVLGYSVKLLVVYALLAKANLQPLKIVWTVAWFELQ